MLKEAIEYVFSQADGQASVKQARKLDFLSTRRQTAYELNGKVELRDNPPDFRDHRVDSVDDLVTATARWGDDAVLWIAEGGVMLILDDGERYDRVTLPLHKTETFKRVEELGTGKLLEQASFIRLLRREFRTSPQQSKVLAAVRKIKFRSSNSGFGTVQHGNESMGREVEAEVAGVDGSIPDALTLPLCVYSNPGERDNIATIAFDLEIDVHQQKFVLRPLPDEVTFAVEASLESIRRRIIANVGTAVTVLYGTP